MMMKRISIYIIRALLLLAAFNCGRVQSSSQTVKVSITNPSDVARWNEPVVIEWKNIASVFGNAKTEKIRLVDEGTRSLAFQIDDLDGDSIPDELAFQSDFGAKQKKTFLLTVTADTLAGPMGPLRTDAGNWKKTKGIANPIDDDDGPGTLRGKGGYAFDGVGWESELIGYRLYLDERNAVDIQGKRILGLQWNFIGSTGIDYQLDAYWGMDVLHIGGALGVGGISIWKNDSLVKPLKLDRRHCRIVARGPVRVVTRVDYFGWDVQGEKMDMTSQFIMYAGDRSCQHEVILRNGTLPVAIVTGIVKHNVQAFWENNEGALFTLGKQSRANDSLMMALNVDPATVVKRTENADNELLVLNLEKEKPLRFLISAKWQGENGVMWGEQECKNFLKQNRRRITEPLKIEITENEK